MKSKNIQWDYFWTSEQQPWPLTCSLSRPHAAVALVSGVMMMSGGLSSQVTVMTASTLLRDFYLPTKINRVSAPALPQHTPCPALTESLRLNTKDGQDPACSNKNTVRAKGWAQRSQKTFIPDIVSENVALHWWRESPCCFPLLDSYFKGPVSLSLFCLRIRLCA